MTTRMIYYTDFLTTDERTALTDLQHRLNERRRVKAEKNGTCSCRCKVPLGDDGSNLCGCCNMPSLESDPDEYPID